MAELPSCPFETRVDNGEYLLTWNCVDYDARAIERGRRAAQRREEARAAERDRDTQAAERDRQMLGMARNINDRMQRNDQRLQEQAEAQANKEAARHAQQDQAAKEQREMMQQLKNQVADLQAQVSKPQSAGPAFDMGALQKMISEGRTEQISKADIKQLIDDAVGKQLAGVARSSDLESAAARMERNLHKVSGASDAQVAQQVQRELTSAINQVGRYVDARQKKIEDSQQSSQHSDMPSQPAAAARMKTEFIVEELPSDDQPRTKHRSSSSHDKVKALPYPGSGTSDTRSQVGSSQKKASVLQPSYDQPLRSSKMSTVSVPPTANDVITLANARQARETDARPSRSSKGSTVSVNPSDANAMVRSKAAAPVAMPEAGTRSGSTKGPKLSTMSEQPSDMNVLVRPKSNHSGSPVSSTPGQPFAPNPAQVPQATAAPSRSSKMSTMSVQPSDMNTLTKAKPTESAPTPNPNQVPQIAVMPPKSSSTKMSTMSVQPSDANALMRPKSSSSSAKMSTMSVQPSDMNALVRPGFEHPPKQDSRSSKKLSTMSIQPSDNNAMVRSQPGGTQQNSNSSAKGSRGSRIQAVNDRRGKARPSPLRQIENVQLEDGMSQALVRQSKDVVKK